MLVAETSCGDPTLIVEDNVLRVLLAANAITLTASAFDSNLHESSHSFVETKSRCLCATTLSVPDLPCLHIVLIGANPRVNRCKDSIA